MLNDSYLDATYAHPDGGSTAPGYFTMTTQVIYAVLSSDKETLTFYYDTEKDGRSCKVYENAMNEFDGNYRPQWYASHETVTTVVFDESMALARPNTLNSWFYNFGKLATIENLNYLNTGSVTDMRQMFAYCNNLATVTCEKDWS